MKKTAKRFLSSVLVLATLAASDVFAGSVSAFAETKHVTYGEVDSTPGIDTSDADAALQYVQTGKGLSKLAIAAASLGLKKVTATNAAMIFRKAVDPTFEFPNGEGEDVEIKGDTPTTLFVVGDSTGCDYASSADPTRYYKRVGFGTYIGEYLNENVTVNNLAISGESSKSFITNSTGNYNTLKNNIKEGDFLLIAFGHNDEKNGDDNYRANYYTNPIGDKDTEGSFKNSLYKNYIQLAEEKGATPILMTPIVRRSASGNYTGERIHQTEANSLVVDGVSYPGGDYSQAIRDLGKEVGVDVIDGTTLTKNLYQNLTPDDTKWFHSWNTSTSVDDTHLNIYGAKYVDFLITGALKENNIPFGAYVNDNISAPDKSIIEVNPDYKEPSTKDLTGDELKSSNWKTTEPWYASVFGQSVSIKKNKIEELSENSVHIAAGNSDGTSGKLQSTSEGMALYYMPITATGQFLLSGTITVNEVAADKQASFGAIVLDTIDVDKAVDGGSYRHVAAAPYGTIKGSSITFARDAHGAQSKGSEKLAADIQKGETFKVSIKKYEGTDGRVVVQFGNTSKEYTIPMEGTAYIGFFATRSADITVSDIYHNEEIPETID